MTEPKAISRRLFVQTTGSLALTGAAARTAG